MGVLWGWAVYAKGTAVAQGWVFERVGADGMVVGEDVQWSRAILAMILPAVVLFLIVGAIVAAAFLFGASSVSR
ncbi:MAG: hypothetical protein HZY76_10690 [Anaerolineae bacterium]|nr:MAG: hypothetical protein HZY76_10690 [Anaerolineae bacterium]